jgi:osmotically-inducible protein OsmY
MRPKFAMIGAVTLLVLSNHSGRGLAQQGIAERVGQKVDGVGRGLRTEVQEINDGLRKRFETVRTDVHRMGAPSRIYARIHWDKALHGSRIEVHMIRGGGVLLRGVVADDEARKRAVALASETVDVTEVIDELTTRTPSVSTRSVSPRSVK